ncbi:MAG: GIY-YIG nuclease family protein [Anaerolineae bacterium]|nr:GIY-YIG nuclease family protein [Anaerolineae bacterium]
MPNSNDITEYGVEAIIVPYKKLLQALLTSPQLPFNENLHRSLPSEGGVYRIFESDSDWQSSIYIGTSNNLQNRIYRSHFMGIRQVSTFKRKLIRQGWYADENAVKQYLKARCKVQFVIVADKISRIAFEHFAVAILKPKYND